MKVQICSDLKITTMKDGKNIDKFLIPEADILLVCGNISKPHNILYSKFLKYVGSKFKKVFIIPGIYEYYNLNRSIVKINELLTAKIKKYKNIVFLNEETYEDDDIIIFASVLWSKINGDNQVAINKRISDFRNINIEANIPLTIAKVNDRHISCVERLKEEIEKYKNSKKKKILLTNFIPINANTIIKNIESTEFISAINLLSDSELFDYYFSDNIQLCNNFDLCCFGNLDASIRFEKHSTTFVCNCGRNKKIMLCDV